MAKGPFDRSTNPPAHSTTPGELVGAAQTPILRREGVWGNREPPFASAYFSVRTGAPSTVQVTAAEVQFMP